jgi:hypothetical protein
VTESQTRLTLAEIQETHRRHGGGYLAGIARLPAEEQVRWAQAQGYTRVQDLLAHLLAWYDETTRLVPGMLGGERKPFGYESVDAFNAVAIARYRDLTRAQVEAEYVRARDAFDAMLAGLSPDAVDNDRAYRWLYATAVEHYEEHRLP